MGLGSPLSRAKLWVRRLGVGRARQSRRAAWVVTILEVSAATAESGRVPPTVTCLQRLRGLWALPQIRGEEGRGREEEMSSEIVVF